MIIMKLQKLTQKEIQKELLKLDGWNILNKKLYKEFIFSNFEDAFGFMTIASLHIEKLDHHPEWCNIFNKIKISLITHDVSGISNKDIKLAKILNKLQANK